MGHALSNRIQKEIRAKYKQVNHANRLGRFVFIFAPESNSSLIIAPTSPVRVGVSSGGGFQQYMTDSDSAVSPIRYIGVGPPIVSLFGSVPARRSSSTASNFSIGNSAHQCRHSSIASMIHVCAPAYQRLIISTFPAGVAAISAVVRSYGVTSTFLSCTLAN